jgi:hypothetical protein
VGGRPRLRHQVFEPVDEVVRALQQALQIR